MKIKTDLFTMKEVYDLLSFYELTHIFEIPFLSALASLKKMDILEEFIMILTGLSHSEIKASIGGNHLGSIFGKFVKRVSMIEKDADMIFTKIESKGDSLGVIKNSNIYADYCITLTKIGNFDPKMYNVADYAYILYKHNLETEEQNRRLEALK